MYCILYFFYCIFFAMPRLRWLIFSSIIYGYHFLPSIPLPPAPPTITATLSLPGIPFSNILLLQSHSNQNLLFNKFNSSLRISNLHTSLHSFQVLGNYSTSSFSGCKHPLLVYEVGVNESDNLFRCWISSSEDFL